MLVRIRPEDARIGMFVYAFDGSWFDHPFWRSHFRVETAEQLQRIRNSGIDGLVIDGERGLIPAADPPHAEPSVKSHRKSARSAERAWGGAMPFQSTTSFAPAATAARDTPRRRRSYAAELRRAKRAIERSRDAVIDMFEAARLGRKVDVHRMVKVSRSIGDSIERDSKALINLVRLKEKDEYTYLHSVAVCALMINFARYLGLDTHQVNDLGVAGLLHDVGKVAVSDTILNKPGALSKTELQSVRAHPAAGHGLLASSAGAPDLALELCLRHHEKIDGTGYPDGLSGDALSLAARMGAICDVYDAVTSNRPYKDAWTPCEALTAMQSWHGHFDPVLLDRFADSLGIFPTGTLVRLSTDELGVVVGSAAEAPENIVVRAFFDCTMLAEIAPVDRAIAPGAEHPRITGRDSATFWRFHDWVATRDRVLGAEIL